MQTPIIPVVAEWIRQCPGTISLGQGVVGYGPPPAALERARAFGQEPDDHKYKAVVGLPELVEAITRKLAVENQILPGSGSAVVVTAGGNMGFLNAILAIVDPGDEVILPTPYYFNHEMAITMASGRVVLVATDANHQLDLERLEAAVTGRTRAIVTVSPNNPTGAVYPEASLRSVNELCARRGLYHIHDEAYEYFVYERARAFSPGSIPGAAGHTISLFSLSKAYGFASWRIGYMAVPAALLEAVRKIQDTNVICAPVISQVAAVGALAAGKPYCEGHLKTLAGTRSMVREALRGLDGRCSVPPADGAFYFLLRLETERTSMGLAEQLVREHRVAVIPGSAFGLDVAGADRANGRGAGGGCHRCHLRVAYGALQPSTVAEGVGRLVAGLRTILA